MKTGINFERCNVGSAEMHNTRDPEYIAAVNASPNKKYSIFEDQTKKNTSWVNPEYSGKSLPGLLDELRAIYKDKVGQAPQEEDRVREITDKKTGMKRTVTTAGWSPSVKACALSSLLRRYPTSVPSSSGCSRKGCKLSVWIFITMKATRTNLQASGITTTTPTWSWTG